MNITSLEGEQVLLLFKIEIRFALKLAFYFEKGEVYKYSVEISFPSRVKVNLRYRARIGA